jgi:hypothetical protein
MPTSDWLIVSSCVLSLKAWFDNSAVVVPERPDSLPAPVMVSLSGPARSRALEDVLSGAWRAHPPSLGCTRDELAAVVPLLLSSGAGALGWWKVRESALREESGAQALQHAYRYSALGAALQDRVIIRVVQLLRQAGIEPILVKGWAVSRLYPQPGLRPYGDIDLAVPPAQYALAQQVLEEAELGEPWVDLHSGFAKLDNTPFHTLYARSELITLGDYSVRVLTSEDHLRILCLHLLRHGAWRPLWLCDVAALTEARPADFDWDRCLGTGNRAEAVICTIRLAHKLLGLAIDDLPLRVRTRPLPAWLVAAVRTQWEAPYPGNQPPASYGAPLATYLRRPAGLPNALRQRWPDPIASTFFLSAPYNDLPRLPFQFGYSLHRAARFLARRDKE